NRCRLDRRMVCEIGADQPPVPSPLIFGVAGRVDAGEPTAGADEALEGSLLVPIEDVSRGAKEDNDPVSGEIHRSEAAGVLGAVDAETVLRTQLCDGGNSLRYRIVAKARGLRKDEDGKPRIGVRRGAEACRHAK